MNVHFISAYYSEKAHTEIATRKKPYWESYMFVWAVKTGQFKSPFTLTFRGGSTVRIGASNISRARSSFGQFIVSTLEVENAPADVWLAPVPSKDAVRTLMGSSRSLAMVVEALNGKTYKGTIHDVLRWTKRLPRAHEGGAQRHRAFWIEHLQVRGNVAGKKIVLIDDVLSTGSTLLAAKDVLEDAGAEVLFAITCGKTVYNFDLKPFKRQKVELVSELREYPMFPE